MNYVPNCAQLVKLGLAGILKFLNTDSTDTGLPCGFKQRPTTSRPTRLLRLGCVHDVSGTCSTYQQR